MIAIIRLFTRDSFDNKQLPYVDTFLECVEDIIDSPQVSRLDDFIQHCLVSRLSHSLGVAYYSFLICHAWGLDYRAAARGGLLHDLFYDKHGTQADFNESQWEKGLHAFTHPKQALKNARSLTRLSKIEEEIIAKHMFPLGGISFKMEVHIVSFVDKCCATGEFFESVSLAVMRRLVSRLRHAFVR